MIAIGMVFKGLDVEDVNFVINYDYLTPQRVVSIELKNCSQQ